MKSRRPKRSLPPASTLVAVRARHAEEALHGVAVLRRREAALVGPPGVSRIEALRIECDGALLRVARPRGDQEHHQVAGEGRHLVAEDLGGAVAELDVEIAGLEIAGAHRGVRAVHLGRRETPRERVEERSRAETSAVAVRWGSRRDDRRIRSSPGPRPGACANSGSCTGRGRATTVPQSLRSTGEPSSWVATIAFPLRLTDLPARLDRLDPEDAAVLRDVVAVVEDRPVDVGVRVEVEALHATAARQHDQPPVRRRACTPDRRRTRSCRAAGRGRGSSWSSRPWCPRSRGRTGGSRSPRCSGHPSRHRLPSPAPGSS